MSDSEFSFSFQGPKATPDFPQTLKRSKSFSDILEEAENEYTETPEKNLFTSKIVRALKFDDDECFKELTSHCVLPIPDTPLAQFQIALCTEIHQILLNACSEEKLEKTALLDDLFHNLSCDIDYETRKRLKLSIIDHCYRFFEIVATYYITPETHTLFAELIESTNILQSHILFPSIFVMLSYLWILYDNPNTKDNYENKKYWSIFCKGCNQLFWCDLINSTHKYQAIFDNLMHSISSVLCSTENNIIPYIVRNEIIMLVDRFFFYYYTVKELDNYLNNIYKVDNNEDEEYNTHYNMFILAVAQQIHLIEDEEALLTYLDNIGKCKVPANHRTSFKLQSALVVLSYPGGPLFPTRNVRVAAKNVVNNLYPVGRYSRKLVNLFFRILHPYYWPNDALYWIKQNLIALFQLYVLYIVAFFSWLKRLLIPCIKDKSHKS